MKELALSNGGPALVDEDVWEWARCSRWHVHPQGYVFRYSRQADGRRRAVLLRREIVGAAAGVEVRHGNGDQLDHRRENLRVLTPAERATERAARFRQTGRPSSRAAGYRGVSWSRQQGAWQACLRRARGPRHLGFFPDPRAAARVGDRAARDAWGETAYQNFPEAEKEERTAP